MSAPLIDRLHLKPSVEVMPVRQRIILFAFRLSSLVLLLCSLVCYSFWFRSADYLGWLPSYDHPDPKTLPFTFFYDCTQLALLVMFWTFFLWLALFLACLLIEGLRAHFYSIIFGVLVTCSCFYLFFGPFLEWFLD